MLQLGDGTQVTVFDKLTTALRLLAYMRRNAQWNVQEIDYMIVVSIRAVKGIIFGEHFSEPEARHFLPAHLHRRSGPLCP